MRKGIIENKRLIIGVMIVLVIAAVFFSYLSSPQQKEYYNNFEGTVGKIVDGDTLYIAGIKIRLALVDTPEVGEDGYEEAAQFTATLCPTGSKAIVDQDNEQLYDKYDRMLAVVYCDGKNLNEELLKKGHAEILTQYCDDSEFGTESWAKDYGC